jgi:hypothetical protein
MYCLDLIIFEFFAVKDYQHMNKFKTINYQLLRFIQSEKSARFSKRIVFKVAWVCFYQENKFEVSDSSHPSRSRQLVNVSVG